MLTIDIIILVILAIPTLVGVFYGFLNITFSLLAWAAASGIAIKFTALAAPMLETWIETPLVRNVLAFAGLFLIGLMIFSTLGYFIVKLLGRSGLTAADRILGLVLGAGLGFAMVSVAIFLAGFTAFPEEDWWQSSRLIGPFEKICIWGQQYLPEDLAKNHGYEVLPDKQIQTQPSDLETAAPVETG